MSRLADFFGVCCGLRASLNATLVEFTEDLPGSNLQKGPKDGAFENNLHIRLTRLTYLSCYVSNQGAGNSVHEFRWLGSAASRAYDEYKNSPDSAEKASVDQ